MRKIKKTSKFLFVFITFAIGIVSCNDTSLKTDVKNEEKCITSYDVKEITGISNSLETITETKFGNNKSLNDFDFNSAEVISFKKTKVISIVIPSVQNTSDAFITYYNPDYDKFTNSFIIDIENENNIETANFFDEEGYPMFLVSFDKKSGKILKVESTSSEKTFSSCMQTAYSSCYADWECALMCDVAGYYCWAAWGIACAVTQ